VIRSWALAGVALALLAGCERTPASSEPAKPQRVLNTTPQPEDIVRVRGDHTQRLLAFLRTRYGDKAGLDAPWKDAWEDTEVEALRPVTRSVCARDTVTADDHEQTLLAVCQTLDDAATVEPGRVDLYVLRVGKDDEEANRGGMFAPLPAKDPLLVMAQRLQGPYGRHGAPGTVQIAQLGPNAMPSSSPMRNTGAAIGAPGAVTSPSTTIACAMSPSTAITSTISPCTAVTAIRPTAARACSRSISARRWATATPWMATGR